MNIRNDTTVATVGPAPDNFPDLHGQECTLSVETYESINQAKKANGLNATTGKKFPKTPNELNAAL